MTVLHCTMPFACFILGAGLESEGSEGELTWAASDTDKSISVRRRSSRSGMWMGERQTGPASR